MKYTVNINSGEVDAKSKTTFKTLDVNSAPDGLAVDSDGNVYVATLEGVQVFAPEDGKQWGTITIPVPAAETENYPTNVAFGGDNLQTLYISIEYGIFSANVKVKGLQQ